MLLVGILLVFVFCDDPCLNFNSFRSREDSVRCVRAVPFDNETFQDILDSYLGQKVIRGQKLKLIDFRIYTEMDKNTGPPYGINVDLEKEFTSLRTKQYDSWFDAMDAIWKVWGRLKDFHTQFMQPAIFCFLYFLHPISILPMFDEKTQQLIFSVHHNEVTEASFDTYNDVFQTHFDFSGYNGWEVLSMNGMDPLSYFKELADKDVFFNRDIGSNFNELIQQKFRSVRYQFFQRWKQFMPLPEGSITYVLKNPTTGVTATLENIDFISCFYTGTKCKDIRNTTDLINQVHHFTPKTEEESSLFHHFNPFHSSSSQKLRKDNQHSFSVDYELICSDTVSSFFYVAIRKGDPEIGVFQVLGEGNLQDPNAYTKEVVKCVTALKKHNVKKLILDVRLNMGGLPRLSFAIATAISRITFPSAGVIQTPCVFTKSLYSELRDPKFGFLAPGMIPYFGMKFFDDHKDHTMNLPDHETVSFAPLVEFDMNKTFDWGDIKNMTGFVGFEPEDIITLSHGAAISAGGQLLRFMQDTRSSKLVVLGGFPDLPIDGACVDLGFTNSLHIENYNTLTLTIGSFFPQSPLYSVYDKSKTDYSKFFGYSRTKKPDFRHFMYEDIGSFPISDSLFQVLKSDFSKCVDWNIRVNETCFGEVQNGVYGNPCVGGKYDITKCVIKRCEDGFFMNEDKTICIKIEDAPIFSIWKRGG